MVKITRYLDRNHILILKSESRDDVLQKLVELLKEQGKLSDASSFYTAILDREKIVSTGIGMGVAIPHAKLPNFNEFFIAIAILQKGVDWHALDDTPVRIVFLIGGPDDKQTEYLQILSGITMAIKDEARRKKMLNSASPAEIMDLFKGF